MSQPPPFDDIPTPDGQKTQQTGNGLDTVTLGIWDAGKDDYIIPPREWLLSTVFCKGFLSSLIADGGVGKSALRMAQILSLAVNRFVRSNSGGLTGEYVFRRCRCLIVSLEDNPNELRRRVYAAMRKYGIERTDIEGWLFLAAPKGLKLAKMVDGSMQVAELEALLREAITTLHLDLICLDPFIKTHSMSENDNNAMDFVCDLLATIAIEMNVAVDFPHHTNKGLAIPGDANRGRGASSTKDAARLVDTLTPMSVEEGNLFALSEADRRSLIRLDSAKVNIAPPSADAKWFRLIGMPLGNGTPDYPSGDNVQTVEPWKAPSTWLGLDNTTLNRILDTIDAGLPNGRRYSDASAATVRHAWHAVHDHAPDKPEKACRAIIKAWKESGTLYADTYDDPVERKDRVGLKVNDAKRPPRTTASTEDCWAMPAPWHPEPLPPLGFRFEHDGQSYECVGHRPYVTIKRKPGREIVLVEWRTECPTCGATFITTAPAHRWPLKPTRRCKACRKPGRRVATERPKVAEQPQVVRH